MKTTRLTATTIATAASIVLALSACGGASAPPADGGSFSSATELKEAFVKAGGKCDSWDPHNKSSLATTSGSCGDDFVLGVFEDAENHALQVSTFKKLGVSAAVGKNWVISGTDATSAQKVMGGELLGK